MIRSVVLFALITIAQLANGQMRATTDDGRKVLLMRDGTWKFADQPSAPANLDCNSLTVQDGNKSAASSPITLKGQSGGSLALLPQKQGELVSMLLAVGDEKCMKTGSVINLGFRDGAIVTMKNTGEQNCDGRGLANLGTASKKNTTLNRLKNTELSSIRVWTETSNVYVVLDPPQSKVILNTFWCLLGR